jgi:hypothetical protein
MNITLKDYKTGEVVAACELLLERFGYEMVTLPSTWFDEFEQALYSINNKVFSGVLADNWDDSYTIPVNPYMTFEFNASERL